MLQATVDPYVLIKRDKKKQRSEVVIFQVSDSMPIGINVFMRDENKTFHR